MFSVVLIGTVALVVAIVGCFVIWRLDASAPRRSSTPSPPAPRPGRVRRPRAVPLAEAPGLVGRVGRNHPLGWTFPPPSVAG